MFSQQLCSLSVRLLVSAVLGWVRGLRRYDERHLHLHLHPITGVFIFLSGLTLLTLFMGSYIPYPYREHLISPQVGLGEQCLAIQTLQSTLTLSPCCPDSISHRTIYSHKPHPSSIPHPSIHPPTYPNRYSLSAPSIRFDSIPFIHVHTKP